MMNRNEGLSTAETAACLGIPVETVKTRFYRAKGLLRKALAEHLIASTPHVFAFDGERCDRLVRAVLARLGLR